MNLLSQRVKFAKREITDLKTGHRRGLGLLKVYELYYDYTSAGKTEGFYDVTITVNFKSDFGPYPFFNVRSKSTMGQDAIFEAIRIEQIEYRNNGYRVIMQGRALYWPSAAIKLTGFYLYSTAPVNSISVVWGD